MSTLTIPPGIVLREPRASDVDALAAITVAVTPQDPYFKWRFPYAQDNRDACLEYNRMWFKEELECPSLGLVAEAPSNQDPNKLEVVGYNFWTYYRARKKDEEVSNDQAQEQEDPEPEYGSDIFEKQFATADARGIAFENLVDELHEAWFDKHGPLQLENMTLAVHPDYQQRGIGRALMQSGLDIAKSEKLPAVTFATEMGKKLYLSVGFQVEGTRRVQVDGDEEYWDVTGLVYPSTEDD